MRVILRVVCISAVLALFCGSLSSAADMRQQILSELQKSDNALRQGTITYKEVVAGVPQPGSAFSAIHTLYYSADGRYHCITSKQQASTGMQSVEDAFDGKDQFSIVSTPGLRRPSVMFDGNQFHVNSNLESMWNLVPGPCFALGRGLSSLTNIALSEASDGVHLRGTAPDRTRIEAVLDSRHGYVAKKIMRQTLDGKTVATWQFGMPSKFKTGVYIATISQYAPIRGPKSCQFVIREATNVQPDETQLACDWHRPGLQIEDTRLGGVYAGIYKSELLPRDITSAQLLEMTRKHISESARLHASDEATARTYREQTIFRGVLVPIIIIGAVITGAAAILAKRKTGVVS